MKSICAVLALAVAAPAAAQTFADPAALDRAVAEFTGAPMGAPAECAMSAVGATFVGGVTKLDRWRRRR